MSSLQHIYFRRLESVARDSRTDGGRRRSATNRHLTDVLYAAAQVRLMFRRSTCAARCERCVNICVESLRPAARFSSIPFCPADSDRFRLVRPPPSACRLAGRPRPSDDKHVLRMLGGRKLICLTYSCSYAATACVRLLFFLRRFLLSSQCYFHASSSAVAF